MLVCRRVILCVILSFLLIHLPVAAAAQSPSLTIVPFDQTVYDAWLPTADTTGGVNTLSFLFSVSNAPSTGSIIFRFDEVSNWPGRFMNDHADATTHQDLCIYGQEQRAYQTVSDARSDTVFASSSFDSTQLRWWTRSDGNTEASVSWVPGTGLPSSFVLKVLVTCEDYGAYGTLRASLGTSAATVQIPKDSNNNHIGDAWETAANGWSDSVSASDDSEHGEQNDPSLPGDGFTVFEEYRGFFVRGVHTRLNLQRKDVFVHSDFDPRTTQLTDLPVNEEIYAGFAVTQDGEPINNFPAVFKVHFIEYTEMGTAMNMRHCIRVGTDGVTYWKEAVQAIYIARVLGKTSSGVLGQAGHSASILYESHTHPDGTTHLHGGVPSKHWFTSVYKDNILAKAMFEVEKIMKIDKDTNETLWGTEVSALFVKALKRTAAHELAHHLGLADHNIWNRAKADPNNPGQPLYKADGSVDNYYVGMGIMFYEQYLMDSGTTFRTDKIVPKAGLRWDYSLHKWLAEDKCYFAKSPGNVPGPHHGEVFCTHQSHWIASDAFGEAVPSGTVAPVQLSVPVLSAVDDVHTATAGSSHTATFSTDTPYTSVKWYVKPPGDTSDRGSLVETDTGDGSLTTASLSYTFATDAAGGVYVITAYVTTSDGVYEVSYEVTLADLPEAPPHVGAMFNTSDHSKIQLTWATPLSDGGSAIIDYEYRYRKSGAASWRDWVSSGANTSEPVSDLTAGTTYDFVVRSENAVGFSDPSSVFTFTTLGTAPRPSTVPTAPLSLLATAGDGLVDLSWQPPLSDGNSSILRYEYRYGIGESVTVESYTSWASMGNAMSSYPVSPLTNDMYHIFEVRAVNAIGAGPPSDPDTATPTRPRIPPGAPTGLTATAGNGRVYLSWTTPTDLGSATEITDYKYRRDLNNDGSWNSWRTMGDTNTSEWITGLTKGRTYAFEVKAVTVDGESVASHKATAFIPFTTPGRPTSFTVSAGNGTVTLSWTAPADDGGGIDNYAYRMDPNNDGSWEDWEDTEGTATSVTVSVQNGWDYGFQVRAENSAGSSTQSVKATALPVDPSVSAPSAPRNLTATAENGQVRLSWNAPATSPGILAYEYKYDTGNDGSWRSWKLTGSTSTAFTVTGLTNDTLYAFKVRARNAGGIGTETSQVTATPFEITVPTQPRNLTAAMTTTGKIRLEWDTPLDSGGGAITDYEYSIDTHDDGSWDTKWQTLKSTQTSTEFKGWMSGITYAFRIRAVNAAGAGGASEKAVITTPDVPSQPLNLTASLQNDGSLYLDWDAPADDGGLPITDYEYGMDTDADKLGERWQRLEQTHTHKSFGRAYYFAPGGTYLFRVRAVNFAGTGTASEQVSITIPAITPPSAPQNLTATAGNASVYLSWSYPADDGGDVADYQYRYRQNGGTWSSWSAEQWQSYGTVSSLTNGTTYEFEVVATNDAGMGTAATVSATPTGSAVPGVPTYFYADSENGAVELWWDPPEFDGGSPITDYEYNYRQSGGNWNGWTATGTTLKEYDMYYSVSGLTNGITYQFKVRAKNKVGPGESTSTLSETPKAQEPDAPTGLRASAGSTTGSIDLSWTVPNANGSPITHYKVAYCKYENGWKNWTDYTSTGSTNASYTLTGLESGELYRFRVRAVNSVGDSYNSKVAQTTAP